VLGIDADFHHVAERRIDVVFDPPQFDLAVLNDGVGTPPVTIARLTDAPRVQDLNAVDFDQKLEMRMSDADDVGFDSPQPGFPCGRLIREEVFIHRIVGGRMHEAIIPAVEIEPLRNRESREVLEMKPVEVFELIGTRGSGEGAEAAPIPRGDALGDRMIVVPPNGTGRIRSDPFDAGEGIRSVVDDISQKETGIKRFLNRR